MYVASVKSNLTLCRSATHQVERKEAERLAQEERVRAAAQVVVSSVCHTMALIATAMLPLRQCVSVLTFRYYYTR